MTNSDPGVARLIESMTPEERDRTLRDLLHQQQTAQGDDTRKIEDALLLLRLRPKVRVTTYIPLTKRYAERLQDRKVWDLGIIDPLADEDIPGRPQIVRVEVWPPHESGPEVLFERDSVLGMPGMADAVRVAVPPPSQRRMVKPRSADLDEGTPPAPVVAGVPMAPVTTDDYDDAPGTDAGPSTIPVNPDVLQEMVAKLERLEAENAELKRQAEGQPEPETPGSKAADRRRGKPVREPTPGAKDEQAAKAEDKQTETVGS